MGVAVAALAAATCTCFAQSALLVVAHDDPDGIVQPGETVKISATVSWQSALMFWRVDGGVYAAPNAGVAANPAFGVPNPSTGAATILHPGAPQGGSIAGLTIQSGLTPFHNPSFILPPWGMSQGLPILEFDWTAPPMPGVVGFDWVPSASQPDVWLFPSMSSLQAVPVPASYVGTSLTVVPAPASLLWLAACCFTTVRRRRDLARPSPGPRSPGP